MKKILFIVLVVICFISCSKSPNEKAKALIEDELFKTLHDFDSYKLVEFGTLDSAFTDLSSVPRLKELYTEYTEKKGRIERIKESVNFDLEWAERMGGYTSQSEARKTLANIERVKELLVQLDQLVIPIDSIRDNFTPEFIGYSMVHKYRAKDRSGNTGLGITRYTFNKDVSEIINRESLDN